MKLKAVSGIMLTLLLIGMLTLAFNIQSAKAESGTIYIRADGSIDPPTANITTVDNVTYTFTGNIFNQSIVVERDNIVVDGAGYTLQGTGSGKGIDLSGRSNVTIRNIEIRTFSIGIRLYQSSNNTINGNSIKDNADGVRIVYRADSNNFSGNNIIENDYEGIYLGESSNNCISGNAIIANGYNGITFRDRSSENKISGNTIINNGWNVYIADHSDYNIISGNIIRNSSSWGILLSYSSNNKIYESNTIENNREGIALTGSSNNTIYHNNFINNTMHVFGEMLNNTWDDSYPSGGNYWSNYTGVDMKIGPNQDQPGSDGIGDSPYVIDANNTDHYPLMKPYGGQHDIGIASITTSKNIIWLCYSLHINIKIVNYGVNTENFNVTVYANCSNLYPPILYIATLTDITLPSRNSTTITFIWEVTYVPYGSLTISAYATPVPSETDTDDNTFIDGWVFVTVFGDATGSGGVDIFDLIKIAIKYDYIYTGPPWIVEDLTENGVVDVFDLIKCAINYGRTIYD